MRIQDSMWVKMLKMFGFGCVRVCPVHVFWTCAGVHTVQERCKTSGAECFNLEPDFWYSSWPRRQRPDGWVEVSWDIEAQHKQTAKKISKHHKHKKKQNDLEKKLGSQMFSVDLMLMQDDRCSEYDKVRIVNAVQHIKVSVCGCVRLTSWFLACKKLNDIIFSQVPSHVHLLNVCIVRRNMNYRCSARVSVLKHGSADLLCL